MSKDRNDGGELAGQSRAARSARRGRRRLITRSVIGIAVLLVISLVGYVVFLYFSLSMGIKRSDALGGLKKSTAAGKGTNPDTNILIMGLDSRLDENGNPLPKQIYDALHAGDQSNGGLNANVLMLLHVPGDGSKATEISIPRDDYAHLAGCPDGECNGKIKQAYGLAFDQESRALASQSGLDSTQRQQKERDAGRKAQIATVKAFLGGVPVDHFVEVTLVAFYQIAQVVQPITVCVNANTVDRYSGANFHKGSQQIDAAQALAFVRQRRDDTHPSLNFTDLDRERRQQAFIASLAYQLKQADTFTNPIKMTQILDVAKQNTAIDSSLDLLSFARQASNLTGGNVTYYTLPIDHFGKDPLGEDVNFVNLPLIQATVSHLLAPPVSVAAVPTAPATSHPSSPSGVAHVVVDAVNSSGRSGLASQLEKALAKGGFTAGKTSNGPSLVSVSVVEFGAGGDSSAFKLASALGGLATQRTTALPAGSLRVVIGTDFNLPSGLVTAGPSASSTAPAPATPVQAAGPGVAAPPPTALSALSGGGVTCVK
jgi:LCP family protein required for cell wall assembly